jgi:two-component system sensor histidine kinase YesM
MKVDQRIWKVRLAFSFIKSFRYKKEFYPIIIAILSLLAFMLIILCTFYYGNYFRLSPGANVIIIVLIVLMFVLLIMNSIFVLRFLVQNIIYIDQILNKLHKNYPEIKQFTSAKKFADNVYNIINNLSIAKQKETSMELLQKQAELDALQSNINPHFLYNILDSIRGTAMLEHAEKTAGIIESLSVFFRYTISQSNNIISIEQELRNVNIYVNIQQYRFNNRFSLQVIIDENDSKIMLYKVPKLTLQPLIENAINHGLENIISNGKIIINIYTTQSRILISVSDNGVGMPPEQVRLINKNLQRNQMFNTRTDQASDCAGIALQNVNNRIKLIYGDNYGLSVSSTVGFGTEVNIVLPLLNQHEI